MAIATGGVVPEGADSVVPIEDVEEGDDTVTIPGAVGNGDNVRDRGGDLRAGETVVVAGTRLGPAHVGALAAAGVSRVRCHRAPRVVVVVTGTELARSGAAARPGRDLRRERLHPRDAGAQRRRRGRAPAAGEGRRRRDAERRSSAASRPTCSSRPAACRSACTTSFAPPRPISASRRSSGASPCGPGSRSRSACADATLVFGLPGNPVSSLVGFELFVRPALLALQGMRVDRAGVPAGTARPARRAGSARATRCCAPARASRTARSCSTRSRARSRT